MKKIISVVILLWIMFLGYRLLINVFFDTNIIEYSIITKNNVFVQIVQKRKKIGNKYNVSLKTENFNYIFDVDLPSGYKGKIIKDVYYYVEGNIECVYSVIEDVSIDAICMNNNKQINYSDIKNKSKDMKQFVQLLVNSGHDYPLWDEF